MYNCTCTCTHTCSTLIIMEISNKLIADKLNNKEYITDIVSYTELYTRGIQSYTELYRGIQSYTELYRVIQSDDINSHVYDHEGNL